MARNLRNKRRAKRVRNILTKARRNGGHIFQISQLDEDFLVKCNRIRISHAGARLVK